MWFVEMKRFLVNRGDKWNQNEVVGWSEVVDWSEVVGRKCVYHSAGNRVSIYHGI